MHWDFQQRRCPIGDFIKRDGDSIILLLHLLCRASIIVNQAILHCLLPVELELNRWEYIKKTASMKHLCQNHTNCPNINFACISLQEMKIATTCSFLLDSQPGVLEHGMFLSLHRSLNWKDLRGQGQSHRSTNNPIYRQNTQQHLQWRKEEYFLVSYLDE